ncbi:LPXTG-motif cell wall-anchored protein [Novosphingobium kunmingense]|uniref:LPXTG-motif cell wall-anchored protein n=2 Tax=Novosphingobium kunmingense TaxID=1211806 RepID=A0A2N0HK37_9SPHN|nr:LPXTG-motif cell wall-anchored protein [Novosphingobium kunmingense]
MPAAQPDTGRGLEALALGGMLAALGAGGLFLLTRRRRRTAIVDERAYEPEYRAPVPPRPVRPAVAGPAATTAVADRPVMTFATPTAGAAMVAERSAAQRAEPVAQASLADGPVPSGSDRHKLVEEMVAAQPDSANPFRTAKARRRRARLILQGREQRLQEKAGQPFDFRQYRPSQNADTGREPAFA